eukprot:4607306-Lingulodinium_polyedra.AAC.1
MATLVAPTNGHGHRRPNLKLRALARRLSASETPETPNARSRNAARANEIRYSWETPDATAEHTAMAN